MTPFINKHHAAPRPADDPFDWQVRSRARSGHDVEPRDRVRSIRQGGVVGAAGVPADLPGPGHVEHDPEDIWSTQLATAKEAIARAGISALDIAAIGVTNQRETTVLWEKATGKPVANAIVWQSRVTAPICDR